MSQTPTRRGFMFATVGLTAGAAGCKSEKTPGNSLSPNTITRVEQAAPPYPQLPIETAAGVTVVDESYPPGDVRRYGAVGNGQTDDAPAIQAAIDVAPYTTNWTVVIPQGMFRVASTVSDGGRMVGSRLLIQGNRSVIVVDTPGGEFLKLASSGVVVSGLVIDGRLTGFSEAYSAAILVLDASDVTIEGCSFESLPNIGIRTRGENVGCEDVRVRGCSFNQARGSSILASTSNETSPVVRLFVHDCDFVAPATPNHDQTRAIHFVSGTRDSRIAHNTLRGTATADYLSGWRDAIMIGDSSAINPPTGILVSGNTITGMADDGVGLSGAHQVSIQNNIIHGSLLTAGVYCPANSSWTNSDVLVSGNTLFDHHLAGIYLKDTRTYTIAGNEIHDCPDGIMIIDTSSDSNSVEGGIVANNLIHHVQRCGILCDGGRLVANGNAISYFGSEPPPPQTRRSGMFLSSLRPGSSITGNSIVEGRHGIVLTGSMYDFVLANNSCTAILGYGIYFIDFEGDGWIITANRFAGTLGQYVNRPSLEGNQVWTSNL